MKQHPKGKKLQLATETLRSLNRQQTSEVAGGHSADNSCYPVFCDPESVLTC